MSSHAGAPAIEARNLSKTYPGDVRALQDLSFSVEPGTIFGLLGPNGAGKSTTVKILTTLARADGGSARVGGFDVLREPEAVRRIIGWVGQKPAADLEATGAENLTLQGQLYGMSGETLRRRVAELLERFGLAEAAGRQTLTYSGGMQRKLTVALGLINRPRVLFLDEPTAGLDPEARAGMWHEITRLAREEGLTILLTTHYLEEADRLADRLAIVDRGRVVVEGAPEQLKQELSGDAVVVELAEPALDGRVRGALDQLDGMLREVALDERNLRMRAERGATAAPAVLAALDAAGIASRSITVSRPSLDDVYLRYAGRTFAQAHEEATR